MRIKLTLISDKVADEFIIMLYSLGSSDWYIRNQE